MYRNIEVECFPLGYGIDVRAHSNFLYVMKSDCFVWEREAERRSLLKMIYGGEDLAKLRIEGLRLQGEEFRGLERDILKDRSRHLRPDQPMSEIWEADFNEFCKQYMQILFGRNPDWDLINVRLFTGVLRFDFIKRRTMSFCSAQFDMWRYCSGMSFRLSIEGKDRERAFVRMRWDDRKAVVVRRFMGDLRITRSIEEVQGVTVLTTTHHGKRWCTLN